MPTGCLAEERYPLEKGLVKTSRRFNSDDGRSTVSSYDQSVNVGTEAEGPFDPVRNGDVILFSINLLKTCEALDLPYDHLIQQEAQALSLKKYVAVVDKVWSLLPFVVKLVDHSL